VRSAQMITELLMDAFFKIWATFSTWLIDNAIILGAVAALIAIVGGVFAVIKWFARGEPKEAPKTDNSQTQNFADQSGGNAAGRDVNIIHNHTYAEDKERYQESVQRQIDDLTNGLERANQDKGGLDADKRQLQSELNDQRAKLSDIEASYKAEK
jgi:hypothetical protein